MLLYALNYKKNKVLNLSIEIPDVSSDSFDDVPAAPRSKSNDKHPIDESINTDIC